MKNSEKKVFGENEGSGKQLSQTPAKHSKSTPPGQGFKNQGGDGHVPPAPVGPRSYRVNDGHFVNSNATGKALHGAGPAGTKSASPGEGFKNSNSTGKALHGEAPKSKVTSGLTDGYDNMDKDGTGDALENHSDGEKAKKSEHKGYAGSEKNNGGPVKEASKKHPYSEANFGLEKGKKQKFTSVDQLKAYSKQKGWDKSYK